MADDDGPLAVEIDAQRPDQHHRADRCARGRRRQRPTERGVEPVVGSLFAVLRLPQKRLRSVSDHSLVRRVHPFDVLGRSDHPLEPLGIDAFGQRHLDDDARDRRVGVEFLDPRDDGGLVRVSRQLSEFVLNADLRARLLLLAGVHAGALVVRGDHGDKLHRLAERVDFVLEGVLHPSRNRFAVNSLRCHWYRSP